MYAVAKKIRHVAADSDGQIPAQEKIEANTPEWRARVSEELNRRDRESGRTRGARADLVRHMKTRFSGFSTGQLTELLGPDERPGQVRYSRYVPEISRYLWPDEAKGINPTLLREIRGLDSEKQDALLNLIATWKKPAQ